MALQVAGFKSGNRWRFLIASYENIRKYCDHLVGAIDLLVCDEVRTLLLCCHLLDHSCM